MGVVGGRMMEGLRRTLLTGAAVCALFIAPSVHAQQAEENSPLGNLPIGQDVPADATLLLTANELTYNIDTQRVIAVGAVQIDYGGYNLVADRIEYDQQTGRLYAVGGIELVEPNGNRIYADELDLTDDFADGFVNALRVETIDNTTLVAESAERISSTETALNNGIYTACIDCTREPGRRPIWEVRARRVIQNGQTQTIRLEGAQFVFLGQPLATVPNFVIPDYQKERQSGFLTPSISSSDERGVGLRVPYYFALDPHYDATVAVTGYTEQGFLGEVEFRQRFAAGQHTLRMAGISQMSREEFDARTIDFNQEERGLISSAASFDINPRWRFGWDLTLQSDENFGRTYDIEGFESEMETSQVYLEGFNDRNSFEMRGYYFDVQPEALDDLDEEQQPFVHPVLDYGYVADQPVAGGELSLDVNLTSLSRETQEFENFPATKRDRLRGAEGFNNRLTGEVEWRRSIMTSGGLIVTPIAAARGDVHANDLDQTAAYTATTTGADDFETRSMLTAGMEARYPVLVRTVNSTHVIEPIAQIFARPDEDLSGGLPNEDAQSFIFDATTLFDRDKFSGFDRIEGGTRANLGFRYTGTLGNGIGLTGVFGQSYQIAGLNSFATDDFTNVGAQSGLETDVSDFVGAVGVQVPFGINLSAGARLDNEDMDFNRTDLDAAYANERFSVGAGLSYVRAQPDYNYDFDRYEVRTSGTFRFNDYWLAFGETSYDVDASVLTYSAIGVGFNEESFNFRLVYEEERDVRELSGRDWSIGARLNFRTLGELDFGG